MRTFLTPPPSFLSFISSNKQSNTTRATDTTLPPHSSHSSRPIRKGTPQQQRMEAEGNADEGNEDEGNADEGNVHTSPLIHLIHLVQYAK